MKHEGPVEDVIGHLTIRVTILDRHSKGLNLIKSPEIVVHRNLRFKGDPHNTFIVYVYSNFRVFLSFISYSLFSLWTSLLPSIKKFGLLYII